MESDAKRKDMGFFILMVAAMLFWGGSWVSGKLVSSAAAPEEIVFWRFLFSFAAFLPLFLSSILRQRQKIPHIHGSWLPGLLWACLSAGILICYNHLLFHGLRYGLAGKGGIIVTTMNPMFTLVLSRLITGEPLLKNQKIGLLIGIAGGVLLVSPWNYTFSEILESGNLLFLAAALAWASLTTVSASAQRHVSGLMYNVLLYGLATAFNLALFRGANFSGLGSLPAGFWLNVLYLAVFAGAIGTGLYFVAAKRFGSGKAGSFTFLVPGFAVLLSWLILGEVPGFSIISGGILAITAVWMINRNNAVKPVKTSQ